MNTPCATALILLFHASAALVLMARPTIMPGGGGEAGMGIMKWKKWKAYESREHGAVAGLSALFPGAGPRGPDIILSLASGYRSTRHDRKQPLLFISGPIYADRNFYRYPPITVPTMEVSCRVPFRIAVIDRLNFISGPLVTGSLTLMRPWDFRLGIGALAGISILASERVTVIIALSGLFSGGVRYPWYRYIDTLCTYNYYRVFGVPVIQIRRDKSPRLGYGGSGQFGLSVFFRMGK